VVGVISRPGGSLTPMAEWLLPAGRLLAVISRRRLSLAAVEYAHGNTVKCYLIWRRGPQRHCGDEPVLQQGTNSSGADHQANLPDLFTAVATCPP
jgi:hypothetical protein